MDPGRDDAPAAERTPYIGDLDPDLEDQGGDRGAERLGRVDAPLHLMRAAFADRAAACASSGRPARVVGVSDGDTITVLTAERKRIEIRLAGSDAPESGRDFGARAKRFASDLAFGKTVEVHARSTDRYGRTVAEVVLPDVRSLNREMVWREAWPGAIGSVPRTTVRSLGWKRRPGRRGECSKASAVLVVIRRPVQDADAVGSPPVEAANVIDPDEFAAVSRRRVERDARSSHRPPEGARRCSCESLMQRTARQAPTTGGRRSSETPLAAAADSE